MAVPPTNRHLFLKLVLSLFLHMLDLYPKLKYLVNIANTTADFGVAVDNDDRRKLALVGKNLMRVALSKARDRAARVEAVSQVTQINYFVFTVILVYSCLMY